MHHLLLELVDPIVLLLNRNQLLFVLEEVLQEAIKVQRLPLLSELKRTEVDKHNQGILTRPLRMYGALRLFCEP